MAFPNRLLSPPSWRLVGLGLTTTIFSLGLGSLFAPLALADGLGVTPTTFEGQIVTKKTMVFLGARDLCIGTTLFWFYSLNKTREMGMLLTSGVTIYLLDIWVAANGPRGWDSGVWGMTGAAAIGTFAGIGLLQS